MTKHDFALHGIRFDGAASFDLPAMMKRKDAIVEQFTKGVDFLFKKNKITRYVGTGRLAGPGKVAVDGEKPVELTAKNIIVAVGSKPFILPGIEMDGKHVGTS